ncbi:MAG: CTP synthase [Bacillota bacterium]|jgi:CTP synthase|nr:CTP synthase [Bacillota bacterium]HHT90036.1 CTP synthase [Bacillota bacterium]
MTKFIFITGGVVSGLGKGITAAALGRLLKQRGLTVAAQKLDPYINVDPGTMSPFQHGEVFVTDDGAETDLDLGHYERFIDENLTKLSNLTSGQVYWTVLGRERSGDYQGGTVQVIPHVTDTIKSFIYAGAAASQADVLIVEIGGTVGDIEGQPFIEAIRQISHEQGPEHCLSIHVTLVPYLQSAGEHKSKPTQHSVKELRSMGISPDIIVTRSDQALPPAIKEKIALFCDVKSDCVIENTTLPSLYAAPLMLHRNGLDEVVCRELGIDVPEPELTQWELMVRKIDSPKTGATIALVGKYVQLPDAYLSIVESLHHAGFEAGAQITIRWVDSEHVTEQTVDRLLGQVDAVLIPGGFGERGIEGKIQACRYARERNLPYLGICLGMQVAVIEFARHVCALEGAHSTEFDQDSPYPVIDLLPGQAGKVGSGGTMRLGAYPCKVAEGSRLYSLYKTELISERHRHRFEFNNTFRKELVQQGLGICGTSPDDRLVEAIELSNKEFFIGVQFHPEFKSRPNRPHPLFLGFVQAAMGSKKPPNQLDGRG